MKEIGKIAQEAFRGEDATPAFVYRWGIYLAICSLSKAPNVTWALLMKLADADEFERKVEVRQ